MSKEPRLSDAKQKLLELQRNRVNSPLVSSLKSDLKCSPRELPAPLSLAQEQVWRLDQTAAKLAPLHNESITIHRCGTCDVAALERSLAEVVRRHEIWRTTFDVIAGQPAQIVHASPVHFELLVTDLKAFPESEREKKSQEFGTQDARQPFDLQHGPLFRVRLVTLSDNEHRLYLTAHQSIVDGITVFDIFPSELTTIYESFVSGMPSPVPELEHQFSDFACWQRRILAGERMERQLTYWQSQLAGDLPALQWPSNTQRPDQQTYRGAMYSFELPLELAQSLKILAQREGATPFMVLLAGLVMLLHRYTGQHDIIVGTLAPSGRKQIEFQRCMGYFLNPVALRTNLRGQPTFSSLLHQVRDTTLGALSNDDVPLDLILERLQIEPNPKRHPLFTVVLSLAPDVTPLPPGWSMTYMDVESGGARWDLYIEMSDRAEGMLGRVQYNPDLFTPSAVAQTVEDFRLLLKEIATPH
jgi:hypothetical protein